VLGSAVSAEIDPIAFNKAYDGISENMLSADGEVAEVAGFDYRKDAAHFTFAKGKILLRRPILGRPTTAIFVGEGRVSITVPTHVERQRLFAMTGDSVVNEEFDICHIRFADDLDSQLRARFDFKPGSLRGKDFRRLKSFQGDYFYKPIPQHVYDNYFELVRSAFNRDHDGFFWARFGRYVFSFDPARADEVEILYNREPTSIIAFDGAKFARQERCSEPEPTWPAVLYPIRWVSQSTQLDLSGIDGMQIVGGQSTAQAVLQRDSTQFLSLYLDNVLKLDSAACDGQVVPFSRRRNFDHVGLGLPHWVGPGDTVDVTLWYHGSNYDEAFPWTENPNLFPHTLTISNSAGFEYLLPDGAMCQKSDTLCQRYLIPPGVCNGPPYFFSFLGYDTTTLLTSSQIPVRLTTVNQRWDSWEREDWRTELVQAFNILGDRFGPPAGVSSVTQYERGIHQSRSGILYRRNIQPIRDLGGFIYGIGDDVAAQWLSSCAAPLSYRENWMRGALRQYLREVLVEEMRGTDKLYSYLHGCRETVRGVIDRGDDVPLSGGIADWGEKGVWVIHMIRNLLNSVDSTRDALFTDWMGTVVAEMNQGGFSNEDLQTVTESYFGYELDWFFRKWLQETGIPKYRVTYATSRHEDGYYVDMDVVTEGVSDNFMMPVFLQIEMPSGFSYVNCFVMADTRSYHLGPYDTEPTKLHFNRSCSVLSEDKVEHRK
jgi:hypothetical protein